MMTLTEAHSEPAAILLNKIDASCFDSASDFFGCAFSPS
jgi:hypothetical protein